MLSACQIHSQARWQNRCTRLCYDSADRMRTRSPMARVAEGAKRALPLSLPRQGTADAKSQRRGPASADAAAEESPPRCSRNLQNHDGLSGPSDSSCPTTTLRREARSRCLTGKVMRNWVRQPNVCGFSRFGLSKWHAASLANFTVRQKPNVLERADVAGPDNRRVAFPSVLCLTRVSPCSGSGDMHRFLGLSCESSG